MKRNVSKAFEYYMSLPYTIEIVPYKEGGFFAKIKELQGCMTEGDTLEEVLEMLNDAKRVWLETALEDGLEIPLPESMREEKEYSGRILLRLPKYLHKKLAKAAQNEGVSINTYIVSLLSETNGQREILRILNSSRRIQEIDRKVYFPAEIEANFSSPYGVYETRVPVRNIRRSYEKYA